MALPDGVEVAIWVDASRAGVASAVLDLMGTAVRPIAVGGPNGGVDELAKTLGLSAHRDLRKLRVDAPAAFLFVATASAPPTAELKAAAAQDTVVLALEPPFSDAAALDALSTPDAAGRVILLPRFERCPGFLAAADPYAAIGRPAQLHMSSRGRPGHGSIFARAFDAWRTALGFVELPETVDAAFVEPSGKAPPDAVTRWTGPVSVLARCADGGVVTLDLHDAAPDTQRRLHVAGPDGHLLVTDGRYRLIHTPPSPASDGAPHDEDDIDASPADAPEHVSYLDLIADHWRRLLDRPPMPANPSLDRLALACVHAMLLSARTGQPERPDQLLRTGV